VMNDRSKMQVNTFKSPYKRVCCYVMNVAHTARLAPPKGS
jgi:hypothetical protein